MKSRPWRHGNVCALFPDEGRWRLWHFERHRRGARLLRQAEGRLDGETAPANLARRTLRHLWQPLLNVAWLPPNQVFLRVIELPACEPEEIPAMVEFEIERLSPLPVADIQWTCEPLPSAPGQRRSVVVIIVARQALEGHLEALDRSGYQPDRLDLPELRELLVQAVEREGAWILARREGGRIACLLAWFHEGRLRYIELRSFADDAQAARSLEASLAPLIWTGEIEGWHTARTRWHLVAGSELAQQLRGAVEAVAGSVEVREPLTEGELARHCILAETPANLIPEEVRLTQRQEFVDRLWMRALGQAALVYIFLVLGYFAFLSIQDYRRSDIQYELAGLYQGYTNALALKAKVELLQNQIDLKFAALDCLKAAADALPAGMTLSSFDFQRGRRVNLFGTVSADQQQLVAEFTEALSAAEVNGRRLFSRVTTKAIQATPGRPASWTIECELLRQTEP
ncbi:MAG: hypothetical protein D6766_10165 [Verrucomicrobia bacterium]|nr:MAG: hypothetical protein D6766_10165 [Verrucomicrobiota bacterium]